MVYLVTKKFWKLWIDKNEVGVGEWKFRHLDDYVYFTDSKPI
jgi:hypothetical protein